MPGTLKFHKLKYALSGAKLYSGDSLINQDSFRPIRNYISDEASHNDYVYWYNFVLRCPLWKDINGRDHYHIYTGRTRVFYTDPSTNIKSGIDINSEYAFQIAGGFTAEVKPYPSFETLNEWNENDYLTTFDDTKISYEYSTYFLNPRYLPLCARKYSMIVENISNSNITISCVKFVKRAFDIFKNSSSLPVGNTGTTYNEYTDILMDEYECNNNLNPYWGLYASYYLDSPVTIAPGEKKVISVNFSVKDSYTDSNFIPSSAKIAIDYTANLCGDFYMDDDYYVSTKNWKKTGLAGNWCSTGIFASYTNVPAHYEQNTDPTFVANKFYKKVGNDYILLEAEPSTDHYESNTSPNFRPNIFYEKIGNDYYLLEEAPQNWSTNYTDYYIFIRGENWNQTYSDYYIYVPQSATGTYQTRSGRIFKDLAPLFATEGGYPESTDDDHIHTCFVGGSSWGLNASKSVSIPALFDRLKNANKSLKRFSLQYDYNPVSLSNLDGPGETFIYRLFVFGIENYKMTRSLNLVKPIETTKANYIEPTTYKEWINPSQTEMYILNSKFTDSFTEISRTVTVSLININTISSKTVYGLLTDMTRYTTAIGKENPYLNYVASGSVSGDAQTIGNPVSLPFIDGAYFFNSPLVIPPGSDRIVTVKLVP